MRNKNLSQKKLDILTHLFRFRFLSTNHIQQILHHKEPNRIQSWLHELKEEDYIISDYTRQIFGANTKPAVYCLLSKSKKELEKQKNWNSRLLTRIYTEKKLKQTFKKRCLFIADLSIMFLANQNTTQRRHFSTKTDLHQFNYFPHPLPDVYLAIKDMKKEKTKRYFLDLFDEQVKHAQLQKRVHLYIRYSLEGTWQAHSDEPLPMILFVCPDEKRIKYVKKCIKKMLPDSYASGVSFFLTTKDAIKTHGLKISIWEKVNLTDYN